MDSDLSNLVQNPSKMVELSDWAENCVHACHAHAHAHHLHGDACTLHRNFSTGEGPGGTYDLFIYFFLGGGGAQRTILINFMQK